VKLNLALAVPILAFSLSALLLTLKLLGVLYYPRIVWLLPILLYAAAFVVAAVLIGCERRPH